MNTSSQFIIVGNRGYTEFNKTFEQRTFCTYYLSRAVQAILRMGINNNI